MDWMGLILGAAAMAAGGILKGAVGAGAPLLVVPLLALLYDVPFAVAIFVIPSLLGNIWQTWLYRAHILPRRFVLGFAGAGGLGALVGSFILANVPGDILLGALGLVVFLYLGLRFTRPDWKLSQQAGDRLSILAGLLGGLMQGAGGVSAPVSVTFLNAMQLERQAFIATIGVFFATMSFVQLPTLWSLGIMTPERAALGLAAAVPLFGAMPVGVWLARFLSKAVFDQIILALLAIIASRLLYDAY
ncbi:MAG: sulfite exporter TauE/SafE family protein, partial [Pseudomonadota bacterium]